MLPRAHRLQATADFAAARREGRSSGSPLLGVAALPRTDAPDGSARIGFAVSRRVGKATTRNLVKRRLRAVAYELVGEVVGYDIVVTARPAAAKATFAALADAARSAIRRSTAPRRQAPAREEGAQ